MTREDIKNAAMEFAYKTGETDFKAFSKGFFNGVRWRINSVWHDAREECSGFKLILSENADGTYDLKYGLGKRPGTFTKRWAYIADLLPDGKEEKK